MFLDITESNVWTEKWLPKWHPKFKTLHKFIIFQSIWLCSTWISCFLTSQSQNWQQKITTQNPENAVFLKHAMHKYTRDYYAWVILCNAEEVIILEHGGYISALEQIRMLILSIYVFLAFINTIDLKFKTRHLQLTWQSLFSVYIKYCLKIYQNIWLEYFISFYKIICNCTNTTNVKNMQLVCLQKPPSPSIWSDSVCSKASISIFNQ